MSSHQTLRTGRFEPVESYSTTRRLSPGDWRPVRARPAPGATGIRRWIGPLGGVLVGLFLAGCTSPKYSPLTFEAGVPYSSVELREGDTVRITFPGAPSLNAVHVVRRDGMINLDQAGEVPVAGKTPAQVEKEILKLYESRLLTREVLVTVESYAYPVYVGGAVLKPGKLLVTEPMTVVEAIMEAGGWKEATARPKNVVVTREEDGSVKHYRLNVKAMMDGRSTLRFFLRPMDVIYVPEKSGAW